ncbi:Ni/Fe-hydrogenase 1 B-type cytochrome subunit [Persephonella hydrogeniphila]|uniref:Ni/Fe-hydrogenase 1 B-type cytochrome subunit n=1 Tax=Persephonella hydrogeniphila TaxID=198703 RepID=A0A285NC48_9AQUI|nr:cytochrome b/b6 domain-containing protein [Persephonella hydrogeniphila]SNZ07020.1 Ni/Fe-hydrogenase 1 B-type cytochrome subunit [Persephonella hydrogeniphila]
MYKKVRRMTATMRIIHWVNVFSIVAAVITGLYIAHPYYQSMIAEAAAYKYVMAYNRWVHFIAAILLDVTSIAVAYLYFFSRFEKPVKKLIPNGQNIKEFVEVVINLLTLNRRKNFDSSHLDSFNAVYFTILHLLLFLMLFTGLQMYVWGLAHGTSSIGAWWPWLLHIGTDWTLWVFGGAHGVRVVHHLTMWIIIAWVAFHIYYQVWRTIFWREGDMAIVFGGYKFKKAK